MNTIKRIHDISSFSLHYPDLLPKERALEEIKVLSAPLMATNNREPDLAPEKTAPDNSLVTKTSKKQNRNASNRNYWTEAELTIGRNNLDKKVSELITLLPNRSYSTISNRLAIERKEAKTVKK